MKLRLGNYFLILVVVMLNIVVTVEINISAAKVVMVRGNGKGEESTQVMLWFISPWESPCVVEYDYLFIYELTRLLAKQIYWQHGNMIMTLRKEVKSGLMLAVTVCTKL